ncbi:MAG TPA: VWA domain-containing protein, partial [Pyrinomonadaceae bacterium]|nr:VWA domain-containing protein [Pyrinomonadaceae bacterium]
MGRIFKDDQRPGINSARPLGGGGKRRQISSRRRKCALLICGLLVGVSILFGDPLFSAHAQSGRRKPTGTPAPTPHGEPIIPPRQTPQFSDKQKNDDRKPPPAPAPDEDDGGVLRVNSTLVPLQASVVGPDGRAVADLKLEDFELTVDGEVKPLSELSRAELPVQMTLLFDNSSSLNPAREFQKKAAVRFFRRVLRPIDQAAIYSISTAPELIQPLTGDVKLLTRVIDNFGKPKGATAMLDTIVEAAEYLRIRQGRKVIVIVSDGADTVSERDFDSTLRAVQAANCQVYAVQTGQYE